MNPPKKPDYRNKYFIWLAATIPGLVIYYTHSKSDLQQVQVPIIWFWITFIATIVAAIYGLVQIAKEQNPKFKLLIATTLIGLAALDYPFLHWWLTLH